MISASRRRTRIAVVATLLALFAAVVPATAASAHDSLVSSDPAADSTVEALPDVITLTFSAELLGDGNGNLIEVTDAAGNTLGEGSTTVEGITVTQQLIGAESGRPPIAGTISVLWRAVSSDGHPISGEFDFTVEGPSAATPTADSTAGSPAASASAEPEPTTTAMAAPSEPSDPSPSFGDEVSSALPWLLSALLIAFVMAVLVYLLVLRPRGGPSKGSRPGADD